MYVPFLFQLSNDPMQIDIEAHIKGLETGNRRMLARTITLVESVLPAHQQAARAIIDRLLPRTGNSVRLGITGVPGAGKSTFIEAFGTMLTSMGHKVAVLAIDPSSTRSGGSILGDKTRMEKLSVDPNAFIRPSPSGGNLGGVARKTREVMLACEAAGFDVIIIETVGVGQSETTVASMVDFFMVLMIAGAGDELQGIKKGVLEVADTIVINKADGDNITRAEAAQKEYQAALHLLMPHSPNWSPPVLTCSSLLSAGLETIWQTILDHKQKLTACGELEEKRKNQTQDWLTFLLDEGLREWFFQLEEVKDKLPQLRKELETGSQSPTAAATELLHILGKYNG